jgi:hypothetical protein
LQYAGGALPFTFIIPRVIVLSDDEVLLSKFNDDSLYFILAIEDFEDKNDTIIIRQEGKEARLSAATAAAQPGVAKLVKEMFKPGALEFVRGETIAIPQGTDEPELEAEGTAEETPLGDNQEGTQ